MSIFLCMCVCLHAPLKKSSASLFGGGKVTAIGGIWRKAMCVCVCVISVQIFLVHYLEAPTDSVSSNLSDLEEDYYLLLYPLFPPASNYTLL